MRNWATALRSSAAGLAAAWAFALLILVGFALTGGGAIGQPRYGDGPELRQSTDLSIPDDDTDDSGGDAGGRFQCRIGGCVCHGSVQESKAGGALAGPLPAVSSRIANPDDRLIVSLSTAPPLHPPRR